MTMRLDENTRGIWYCLTIPENQDFLLTLNQLGEEHYEITYRFRYYHSDDPFDEKDEKKWFSGEVKGKKEKEVITKIHGILEALAAVSSGKYVELLRDDRPFDEFIDEFMEQDFVHSQRVH